MLAVRVNPETNEPEAVRLRWGLVPGSADDLKSLDDLWQIPPTVKQDLRESETAHPPWGDYRFTSPNQCVRMGTSTGTTGTPTVMLWTRHDIWVEYESGARIWWRNGWRPGMIATHAHKRLAESEAAMPPIGFSGDRS